MDFQENKFYIAPVSCDTPPSLIKLVEDLNYENWGLDKPENGNEFTTGCRDGDLGNFTLKNCTTEEELSDICI